MQKCSCTDGEGTRGVDIRGRLAKCRVCGGVVNELPEGWSYWAISRKDGTRLVRSPEGVVGFEVPLSA
jgi:hypothetical protein